MSMYDPHHGIPYEKEAFEALIATPQPHGYVWRDGMLYAMPRGSSAHTFFAERLNELSALPLDGVAPAISIATSMLRSPTIQPSCLTW